MDDIQANFTFQENEPINATFEAYNEPPTIEVISNDYNDITNKPSINNVELVGNKTLDDLGIQPTGDYATKDELPNLSGYATKDEIPSLDGYVKNTDYAQGGVAGVVKASGTFACGATNGYLQTMHLSTIERYNNLSQYGFIGKGTLETVLTQYSKTVSLTEADYNALETKDTNTLYLIEE